MIAIPAVDLRDGACVQLVNGSYDAERVRLDDPREVARQWSRAGFERLHLVDLDAATGVGANDDIVESILSDGEAIVQVGGGIRTSSRVDAFLADGAARVVVGTRAFEEPDWIAEQAERHPGVIIVAADARGRRISVRGWSRTLNVNVVDAIRDLGGLPLAGVLVTAVELEGRLAGPDLGLVDEIVHTSALPVVASGGIATMDDLRALEERGAAAAVIGMALYTGAMNARAVAEEFGA